MKFELGRCLLQERLVEYGITVEELMKALQYKRERIFDYIENKRMMPLAVAISVADTVGCTVNELYELTAIDMTGIKT
ncbi:helix-turn-helix domain-containing protein [Paenibacillus harenae]|uniref:helix-turn-helix domain-containing protein n=1 Tax=Paenibacillus harenae TaxID=306543 RepID=UPI002794F1D2|nr:helix-turn-helix transcriptional regulator [Paenibacillus harenae]MDQ0062605.1 plasmid maintenance system antidote protein VapI [Paenibacillus harenae]